MTAGTDMDLDKLLTDLNAKTPYGKLHLTISRANGATTNLTIQRDYPERFNYDNAKAQNYVNGLIKGYMAAQMTGKVSLELLFKQGNLMMVTESATTPLSDVLE